MLDYAHNEGQPYTSGSRGRARCNSRRYTPHKIIPLICFGIRSYAKLYPHYG